MEATSTKYRAGQYCIIILMNVGRIFRYISDFGCTVLLGILFSENGLGQSQYSLLSPNAGVQQITAAADGSMWFTESGANKIGKITPAGQIAEYAVPTPNAGVGPITSGPDGNIWFGEIGKIGKITPDGKVTEYAIAGGGPYGLAAGADGNIWFTERLSSGAVGKVTPDGEIMEYALPNNCCVPGSIILGPDNNLWFTEESGCYTAKIGKITASGAITEFDVPFSGAGCMSLGRIRPGPDGNLWFVDISRNIWRITRDGKLTSYPSDPLADLIPGPDGRMWFQSASANLRSITMDGIVSEHRFSTGFLYNFGQGPDGSIWGSTGLNSLMKIVLSTCSYTLDAAKFEFPAAGGTFEVHVQTGASCEWGLSGGSFPIWLSWQAGGGPGPGSLSFTVAPNNSSSSRSTTFSVAGVVVNVSQSVGVTSSCSFSIYPRAQWFPASGGTGSVTVNELDTCTWTRIFRDNWITDLDGTMFGTGSGTVHYAVKPAASFARMGIFSVGPQSFFVVQQGEAPLGTLVGSMPHIAVQGDWSTTFTFVSKSRNYGSIRFRSTGDDGNPLQLPFVTRQRPASNLPEVETLGAGMDYTAYPKATLVIRTTGSNATPVQVGAAQLESDTNVDGFAIFSLLSNKQEAVVPLETRDASSYLLAFDQMNGVVLGVAVQNVSGDAATIPVVIRDDTGAVISPPGTTLTLAGSGHGSFVLAQQYPFTANKRGTVEFDTPLGRRISVLGIRTPPLGNSFTFTTIPALADIGTNGGSIAHIATGAGWQTTFVLVNTGKTAAQATLKFFATGTGAPLSIPLSFPQTGTGATTANLVSQTLAAGATLVVESAGPAADALATIGSAQLTTDGNVGGFVVFRYNPNGQEAVVPLENRTANGFLIAFDNTGGVATGIAVNNATAQSLKVPVIIRDDGGAQIATDSLDLAPNGHLAFTLALDRYTITANKRGTVEFLTPAGGQIGALGIRVSPSLTLTTLPALAE